MTTTDGTAADERLCQGHSHSQDRPPPRLREGEHLCGRCVGRTMHALEGLSADLAELDVTVGRLSRVRLGGTAGRGRRSDDGEPIEVEASTVAREMPVAFDERASSARREIEGFLVAWAVHIAEQLGIDLAPASTSGGPAGLGLSMAPAMSVLVDRCRHDMIEGTCADCRGLPDLTDVLPEFVNPARPPAPSRRTRPPRTAVALAVLRSRRARNWYRTDEQGPTCAATIAYVRGLARRSVDRYDRRWYAGECGQPTTVIDLVEVEEQAEDGSARTVLRPVQRETTCACDLYAAPGKAVISCDGYREPKGVGGCGALHPAVTRHRYVVATVRSRRLPLDVILSVVPQLLGQHVMPDDELLKKWRQRGKLRPVVCLIKHPDGGEPCRVCRGEIFDGGQVFDLLLASYERRRKAKEKAEAEAKEKAEAEAKEKAEAEAEPDDTAERQQQQAAV